ncbi:MAG: hypothetical protein ABR574_09270 [Cryomorphaceae bacterium]|nr:hypothetical protein [Flavobacteriales bacterium]
MKYFLLIACVSVAISSYSQSEFDQRLTAKFSEEQLQDYRQNHPAVLAYWNFYLENSYEIASNLPMEKLNGNDLPTIKLRNPDKFNIFESDLHPDGYSTKYFRIKGSNDVLILFSKSEIAERFNAHRKTL